MAESWPKSGIPCRVSALWMGLCLYGVISGCLLPRGNAVFALAAGCYGVGLAVSMIWAKHDRRAMKAGGEQP